VKRSIGLAVLIILAMPSRGTAQIPATQESQKRPLTIESIFVEGGITGRGPESIEWSPDNTKVSFLQRDDPGERGELWSVDAVTGERKLLVSEGKLATLAPPISQIKDERQKEWLARYHVPEYLWSPDSQHLLFNSQGQLWLYTIANGTAVQFTSTPDPSADPKFSPDGSRVAYVNKHNLYVRSTSGKGEKQLTKNKDENLLNGEVDWVYAEELNVRSNYFWSPDGKDIAFLQMDETQVPTYPITDWLPTHPKVELEKYPKAGDPNPAVRLGVISAAGRGTKWISLTEDQDIYIPRFGWVGDNLLWAEVLNRAQNKIDLYFADARSGHVRKVLTENIPDAWVNVNDDFRILHSGDRFLWSSWRDGHTHLYLYSFDKENPLGSNAKLERQLTHGDFEALKVEDIDEEAGIVYFACNDGDPREQHIDGVKLDGSMIEGWQIQRLSLAAGTHEAMFAGDAKHYVDKFSTALSPPGLSLCKVELREGTSGKQGEGGGSEPCQTIWESRPVSDFSLSAPKFLQFKADDGTTLYGQLLVPPDAPAGKIPLIVHVYGGPAAQLVRNDWSESHDEELFHQILARRGFAIFSVDNRGTPGRDRKFSRAIRHQFGGIELKDQLTTLDQLLAQFPQLDRSRIGIWGWSNGGFVTLYALTHSDRFKAGVAVAPVTDWRDYDSIYTERYMGLPNDNVKGYEDSSIHGVAGKLRGALLLVHGSSDDNVHFQNSIQMTDALIKSGRQFRLMVYPNKTHGIGGAADREHLYHMIEEHFERELMAK
jgi:dipeptidyl-peptidase-4